MTLNLIFVLCETTQQWPLILFIELRAILWKFILSTAVYTPLFSRMIHKLKLS